MINQGIRNLSRHVPSTHLAGGMSRAALGLSIAFASLAAVALAAMPSAALASAKPHGCPSPLSSVLGVQVRGLSCKSADAVIRFAVAGKAKPRGFSCRSKLSRGTASVICRRGKLEIAYRTAPHSPATPLQTPASAGPGATAPAPPTPTPTPTRSPPPASGGDSVRIDAAIATPTAHPMMVEGGETLRLEMTISDQTPWADSILVYATVPGQPCATGFEGADGYMPGSTKQEEIGEGVEALIDKARQTGPSGEPGPVDTTISIPGNYELTPQFSTVCAVMYSSSTYGFPTQATAQEAITAG